MNLVPSEKIAASICNGVFCYLAYINGEFIITMGILLVFFSLVFLGRLLSYSNETYITKSEVSIASHILSVMLVHMAIFSFITFTLLIFDKFIYFLGALVISICLGANEKLGLSFFKLLGKVAYKRAEKKIE